MPQLPKEKLDEAVKEWYACQSAPGKDKPTMISFAKEHGGSSKSLSRRLSTGLANATVDGRTQGHAVHRQLTHEEEEALVDFITEISFADFTASTS